MDPQTFERKPILGILRGVDRLHLSDVLERAIAGGLETIEIALNSKGAIELISEACTIAGSRLVIGAGTVLDVAHLEAALAAGASFVVTPTLVDEVVAECVRRRIPVFPGALTPHEILAAWRAGATMVKVFPARAFGPGYLRDVKGPFEEVKLLACGGVSTANVAEFVASGADAVAFGSGVFKPERIAAHEWESIEGAVREIVEAEATARAGTTNRQLDASSADTVC